MIPSLQQHKLPLSGQTLEIEQVRRGPRETDAPGTVPQPRFAHSAAALSWSVGGLQVGGKDSNTGRKFQPP